MKDFETLKKYLIKDAQSDEWRADINYELYLEGWRVLYFRRDRYRLAVEAIHDMIDHMEFDPDGGYPLNEIEVYQKLENWDHD